MIYSVTGNVVAFNSNMVAVDVNGVAFNCITTMATAQKCACVGSKVTLLTHLNVREDAMELYGFYDKSEMDCFKLLITVNGVGPKMALAILSSIPADKVALSIASEDIKTLTTAQGVGKKLAQRIVMELKDKVAANAQSAEAQEQLTAVAETMCNSNTCEAVEALQMLGYSQSEAGIAVSKIDASLSVEEIIKQALKSLSN